MDTDTPGTSSRVAGWHVARLALQTAGAAIVLWQGLPIYREVLADPSKHVARSGPLFWGLVAVAAMQSGYWIRRPELPRLQRRFPFLAHLVQFAGRLGLVFMTGMFSVFVVQAPEGLKVPALHLTLLIAVLFSMFCYSLELERLGRCLQGPETKSEQR